MADSDGPPIKVYILLTVAFMTLYVLLSSRLKHSEFLVHRTTVATIVGIIAGFILYMSSPSSYETIVQKLV